MKQAIQVVCGMFLFVTCFMGQAYASTYDWHFLAHLNTCDMFVDTMNITWEKGKEQFHAYEKLAITDETKRREGIKALEEEYHTDCSDLSYTITAFYMKVGKSYNFYVKPEKMYFYSSDGKLLGSTELSQSGEFRLVKRNTARWDACYIVLKDYYNKQYIR